MKGKKLLNKCILSLIYKTSILLSSLYFSFSLHGQTDSTSSDSLIKFSDLIFNTPTEEFLFRSVKTDDKIDFFQLALFANPTVLKQPENWYVSSYNKIISQLEQKKITTLKPEKQVKLIYTLVHEEVLKQYNVTITFDNVFENGNFNCVTGSILFALILDHYNIPFEGKETANHVFLVAKTNDNSNILLESTDPKGGYVSYDQSFKDKFIQYLVNLKLTTSSELSLLGSDSVFNKYYFPKSNLTLTELVGLLYYNNAIDLLIKLDNANGLQQLLKSYYLYPCEKTKYLILQALVVLLNNSTYLEETDWQILVLISRFNHDVLTNENIKDEFNRLTYKLLVDKSDLPRYQDAYRYVYDHINDSILRKDIAFIYCSQTGRYFYVMKRLYEAYPLLETAYTLNPQNYEIKAMYIETLMSYLETLANDRSIQKFEEILINHHDLEEDARIRQLVIALYIYQALSLYEADYWNEGDVFLDKFESKLDEYKTNQINSYSTAVETYNRVATHYFRLNNKQKARSYIDRGLRYFPYSYELKRSLEALK